MATNSSHARMPTGFTRPAPCDQEVLAAEREQDEQQVAGEHVREESQGQRDRPHHDVGHELQRDEQQQDRARDARRARYCSLR